METQEVVIIDGVRTPFGRMGGVLRNFTATELGSFALRGLLDRTKIDKIGRVDAVFAGTAGGDLYAGNIARYIALQAMSRRCVDPQLNRLIMLRGKLHWVSRM